MPTLPSFASLHCGREQCTISAECHSSTPPWAVGPTALTWSPRSVTWPLYSALRLNATAADIVRTGLYPKCCQVRNYGCTIHMVLLKPLRTERRSLACSILRRCGPSTQHARCSPAVAKGHPVEPDGSTSGRPEGVRKDYSGRWWRLRIRQFAKFPPTVPP